jgi:hypothetical protein
MPASCCRRRCKSLLIATRLASRAFAARMYTGLFLTEPSLAASLSTNQKTMMEIPARLYQRPRYCQGPQGLAVLHISPPPGQCVDRLFDEPICRVADDPPGRGSGRDITAPIGNHTFRATGITSSGALEHAREMAAHKSPRTTKLYDHTRKRLTQNEVERIHL